MASSSHKGGNYYGATPYRSSGGLSTRASTNADEIQLRIDPMHTDLDDEVSGLRKQVRRLKNVASEIESEAKDQTNDTYKSSSRGEEQHAEIKQEHHPVGIKPCSSCCPLCSFLCFSGLHVVQVFKMRYAMHAYTMKLLNTILVT